MENASSGADVRCGQQARRVFVFLVKFRPESAQIARFTSLWARKKPRPLDAGPLATRERSAWSGQPVDR